MSATATKRAKLATIEEKIERYLRIRAAAKRGYKRADAILDDLEKEMTPGVMVKLSEQRSAVLKDKGSRFSVGQTARRFEIEVSES